MAQQNKFLGFVLPNGIIEGQTNDTIKEGIDISVSVCYYINKEYEGLDSDHPKYTDFYNALQGLKEEKAISFMLDNAPIGIEANDKSPFSFLGNEINDFDIIQHKSLKDILWEAIFPLRNNSIKVNPESKISRNAIGKINNLFGENNGSLYHLNSFLTPEFRLHDNAFINIETKRKNSDLTQLEASDILTKANEFGLSQMKISYANNLAFLKSTSHGKAFIKSWSKDIEAVNRALIAPKGKEVSITAMLTKYYTELLDLKKESIKSYLIENSIDIDEVINNYTSASHEVSLMRLMGLIQDFKIKIPKAKIDTGFFNLSFKISGNDISEDVLEAVTKINIVKQGNKYAFLVADSQIPNATDSKKSTYYNNSILRRIPIVDDVERNDYASKLIRVDKMAIENKLKERSKKINNGEKIEHDDLGDALTRGILFTNPILNKIITPQVLTDALANDGLTDDFTIRGHRIGLIQIISDTNNALLYPLTKRDISISVDNKIKPIFKSRNFEGCISFDTPSQYMQDGEINSAISDVLFEYSGELLSLKSAFSKANKIDNAEHTVNKIKYNHDSGLFKSQARFELPFKSYDRTIGFSHYPFNEVETKTNYLTVSYDIPKDFTQKNSPKLRFGKNYSFVVYQEYLNGWALPISETKKNIIQLTLSDLAIPSGKVNRKFVPNEILFNPLESKQAIQIFHRKEVHDEPSKPIAERASLEHLIVRSDSGEDSKPIIDERHILPPKIEFEHAFWHNLLSPPKMDSDESFELKRRHNCKFHDKLAYNKFTDELDSNGNNKTCPEGCESYCGGTHMKPYYSDKHITPRFLTDPTVVGFKIKLFWDKECLKPIALNKYEPELISYGGTLGVEPKSYLLRVAGATEVTFIENHDWWEVLEIFLKKGVMAYAKITNEIESIFYKKYINDGWWKDLEKIFTPEDLLKIQNSKNIPKQISLTHAVKLPLITPEIIKLSSTPNDHKYVEHINEWLKKKEYEIYKLEENIIAERIDKTTKKPLINSSFTKVELFSHFERLDAIRKIEFLKDIIPTGALELWMRKEEFIDDPNQIVLSSSSPTNHLPNEPVVPFKNQKNVFNLDYKIEFSNEIMAQLKNIKHVQDIDGINDEFRSLITKLNLAYDFKTTKFEEREYYLKDISKFKGFFTDEKFSDNGQVTAIDKLEEFVLPKREDVMNDSKLRFKVIVLNNRQPNKPDVAFAVTTIQETRSNPSSQRTISIQKGNIVTIYLKRGRLTSGKDERVGIIADAAGLYNKLFKDNDWISKVGRDIISDKSSNRSQYLQFNDIVIPEQNDYEVEFDNELGIYHFLPQFDVEKQLWKFEVELNIKTKDEDGNKKDLHNPFINFSIVHYQPFSLNYNDKTADASLIELKNDCRISDVENSTWCYLLPERKLSVFFDTPNWMFDDFGDVDLTVSFDHESLHHFNTQRDIGFIRQDVWIVRSNFIVTVQGSVDGIIWHSVGSWLDNGKSEVDAKTLNYNHPLLSEEILKNEENLANLKLKFTKWANPIDTQHSYKYSNFRVRFIEVEWFSNETWDDVLKRNEKLLTTDIVDNEEMRIRFVEIIY